MSVTANFAAVLKQPTLVVPNDGHHEITLRPNFDWGDVSGATSYTIQISTSSSFVSSKKKKLNTIIHTATTVASEYTPAIDLPVGATLYWHVQANGANPSEWSGYRSFSTPNPPSAPILTFPANTVLIYTYSPLLTWSTVSVPTGTTFDHYQLQLDDDPNFSSPLKNSSISNFATTQFQVTPSLPANSTFYWRVYAFNTDGESSLSQTYSFRTAITPPVLIAPPDGGHVKTLRPSFDWGDVNGAISYTIQISKSPAFVSSKKKKSNTIILTATTISSNYTPVISLPVGSLLYWRVVANGTNGPSLWSDARSFTTANPPSAPVLTFPGNNALLTDYAPLLTWKAAIVPIGTTFDHYQLQLDDDADFSSPLVDTSISSLTTTQYQVSPALPDNSTFYWRVVAFNTDGESNLSLTYSFRTSLLPVVLTSPSEGATVGSLTPFFDWEDVNGATSYTIQIATAPSFASSKKKSRNTLILSTIVVDSEYATLSNLPSGVTLYWRVSANGPNGPTVWTTGTFITP